MLVPVFCSIDIVLIRIKLDRGSVQPGRDLVTQPKLRLSVLCAGGQLVAFRVKWTTSIVNVLLTSLRESINALSIGVPWQLEEHAPAGKTGCTPFVVSTMHSIHFLVSDATNPLVWVAQTFLIKEVNPL